MQSTAIPELFQSRATFPFPDAAMPCDGSPRSQKNSSLEHWRLGLPFLLVILWDRWQRARSRFLGSSRPATCRGSALRWSCCLWTPTSLAAEYGTLEVSVSHGIEETTGRTVKSAMPLASFAQMLAAEGSTPYLKQLDLEVAMPLEQQRHLRELQTLEVALTWWGTSVRTYLWMGSAGCITGLHNDDEDNFLVQCQGTKRVCLFPPEGHGQLYVNTKYDSGTRCCDVDVFNPDYKRHPRFKDVTSWEVVELHPGDVLFIPAFWWHAVLTTSRTSISLNSFVSRPLERLTRGLWRQMLDLLHSLGYRKGNCVCHAN